MSPTKAKKAFDCLEFKEQVQEKIYEDIKNLSVAEQIAYFQKRIENSNLGDWWQSINLPPK
jgi:pyridoxine/pyridoxamine 5'-phosphate oxidase